MKEFLKKLSEVLGSQNFFVALVSIFLTLLSINNIQVEGSPRYIVDLFWGKNSEQTALLLVNFANPLLKLVKKVLDKTLNWKEVVKSSNFRTNVLSLFAIILGAYMGEEMASTIIVLLVQAINMFFHINLPLKYTNNNLKK